MFDQSAYDQSETRLDAGDLLVAYSDGITEAENRTGHPFDEDGLERAVHMYGSSPAPDLAHTLFTVVEQHAGDMKLMDDLTIVVVKRTDAVPPPLPTRQVQSPTSSPPNGASTA
jgi:sigma-B regulation protein RsbU (phosphoserine phosphatase)